MKILLISNNTFAVFGGYEKVVYSVLNMLSKKYNCEISILSIPHYKTLLSNPILEEFKKFKIFRSSDYKNKTFYILTLLMKKFFSRNLLLNKFSVEMYIDEIKNNDIMLITDPLLILSVKNVLLEKKINKKIVYWDHGSLSGYLKGFFQKIIYYKEIKDSINATDAHLAISSGIYENIKKINSKSKVFIVYNPIEKFDGLFIKKALVPTFLYVGRIENNQKNLVFMLKGLSKIKDKGWKLKIIGTGKDEKKLKKLATKLNISSKIEWLGFKKDPFADIKEATVLLLTSRWEGLPTVLIEANQRGIPVISSNCRSGPKDIILPGKNGYLYEEGNLNDFVKVINDVIDGKKQFDAQEDIAGTTKRFREDVVISNIYNLLNMIINEDF